jgi:hypothetical protein
MGGDDSSVIGITQRELLLEMREDIRGLKASVDAVVKDQALGVERRAAMQRSADGIYARLDGHDRDLDRVQAGQNRADGALVLAHWALGRCMSTLSGAVAGPTIATRWQDRVWFGGTDAAAVTRAAPVEIASKGSRSPIT